MYLTSQAKYQRLKPATIWWNKNDKLWATSTFQPEGKCSQNERALALSIVVPSPATPETNLFIAKDSKTQDVLMQVEIRWNG